MASAAPSFIIQTFTHVAVRSFFPHVSLDIDTLNEVDTTDNCKLLIYYSSIMKQQEYTLDEFVLDTANTVTRKRKSQQDELKRSGSRLKHENCTEREELILKNPEDVISADYRHSREF